MSEGLHERIRELFVEGGSQDSITRLALRARAAGIAPKEKEESAVLRWYRRQCREALRNRDMNGMPFAGPSATEEDGNPVWKQRELWDPEDYRVNVEGHVSNRDANHVMAVKLADECETRYGVTIPVPDLPAVRVDEVLAAD